MSENIERFSLYRGTLAQNTHDGEYVRYSDHERIVQSVATTGAVSIPDAISELERMRDAKARGDGHNPLSGKTQAKIAALNEAITRLRALSPSVAVGTADCDICGGSGKVTAGCAIDKPSIESDCWKCVRRRKDLGK